MMGKDEKFYTSLFFSLTENIGTQIVFIYTKLPCPSVLVCASAVALAQALWEFMNENEEQTGRRIPKNQATKEG